MYSFLVVKIEIIYCFLLYQEIITLYMKKQFLIIDFLSSKSLVLLLLYHINSKNIELPDIFASVLDSIFIFN